MARFVSDLTINFILSHYAFFARRPSHSKVSLFNNNTEFFQRKDHKGQYKTWFHLLDVEGGRRLLDALGQSELQSLVEDLAQYSTR